MSKLILDLNVLCYVLFEQCLRYKNDLMTNSPFSIDHEKENIIN